MCAAESCSLRRTVDRVGFREITATRHTRYVGDCRNSHWYVPPGRQGEELAELTSIATGFVAIAFVLAMLVLLNTKSRARWVAEFRSVPALCLFTVGLLLASLDLVLAVARESFVGILVRRILETASQVLLTIGLVGSYYPLPLVDRVGSSSGGRKTPSKAAQAQPRQSAGKPQRPSRPSIGQPVTGSFHRMSHAATRSFHTAHGERRQKGQDDDWNKEDSKQHDRVLMRTVSS